ncbi:MAG: LysM peptidoglycan-binding domain-containing protein [Geminicoccaceae bacterium]|nr:MAG: LysM peptidoglycan-binding domain-containing protein [Geminicoccaceae bacterium]
MPTFEAQLGDRRRMSWFRRLAASLAIVMAVASCTPTVNPATGIREATLLTPAAEARIGAQEHPRVLAQFGGAYDNPRVARYVTDLGNRLKNVSEMADQTFTFTVLDTPIPNAFALPGGFVYVTRGLLTLANDEAELAGVIAHEIGHITARHAAQRYDRAVAGQIGATLATILGGVLLGDAGAQLGQQAGGTAAMAWVQGFSREQEFEADLLGVRYLSRAGYDPMAMATFLESLQAQDRLQRLQAGRDPHQETFSMYASHPRTVDRVVRAAAAADGAGGRRDQGAYFAVIDGMRFGDDPREGFVRDGAFVHPELRFRWRVPAGFEINNRPEAVYGRDRSGMAMIFDGRRLPTGADLVREARTSLPGVTLAEGQPRRINGQDGAIAFGSVALDNRPGEAVVAVVRHGGDQLYRFVFLKPGGFNAAERQRLLATIDSFQVLSAAEAARFPGTRLRIVTVGAGDSVQSLANRMAIDGWREETFRVLNGLGPTDRLQPGQRVKLVVAG